LFAVLRAWKVQKAEEALSKGEPVRNLMFPSEKGTFRDPSHVVRDLRTVLKKAGLRHIRFHDLRHTYASLLLQNRESPVYVNEQLGHHSIQITVDTYGHLIPGANRQAVNRLDDAEWRTTGSKSATPTQPGPSRDESPEGGKERIILN
jgi:integrase